MSSRPIRARAVLLMLGCTGAGALATVVAVGAAPLGSPEPPIEARTVRRLLTDVTAARACERMKGVFSPLFGQGDEAQAEERVAGRLWIEQCTARPRDDDMAIELTGRAWRWVDRERERLGAQFEVADYVRFRTEIKLVLRPDLAYDREAQIASLYLVPTQPVEVGVEPIQPVQAEAEGGWGALLGAAGSVIGRGPDEQATGRFEKQARRTFRDELEHGYTLVVDACTGQTQPKIGRLAPGEKPWVPVQGREAPERWLTNQRVALHAGGLDVQGPWASGTSPIRARVHLREGGPITARLVCAREARALAEAFLADRELPDVQARADAHVAPGATQTLEATADCPLALVATVDDEATLPATFDALVTNGGEPLALAPCS